MRKELILPGLALAGGLAGFGLRRWELASAFEAETGLAIANSPATLALIAFTVAMVAALALLSRGARTTQESYDRAFAAKGNTLYMILMTASAGLFLLSGGLTLADLPAAYGAVARQAEMHGVGVPSMLTVAPKAVLSVLCLLTGWQVFRVGSGSYRGKGGGRFNAALLTPAYTACMWLIVSYQQKSGDPVVLDYAWQLFAIISAVLGTYFMAGFAFERGKVFLTAFSALCGVYFILVTLADGHDPAMLLLCGAFLLYLLPSAVTLLFNAGRPAPKRMPEQSQETDPEHFDWEETDHE